MRGPRGIFISYRRATNSGYAGRIRDHLVERYGDDNVFMDVDSIGVGTDFVDAIDASLRESRAVLVVIDPAWVSVPDADGTPRLANEGDWVRTEIERSLGRADDGALALVPVLVGGAEFPTSDQLPETLQALTRYNGVELRDTHFESDLDDVMARLGRGSRRLAKLAGAGLAVVALVLVLGWLTFRDTTPDVSTLDSTPMTGDLNVAVAEFTTLDDSGSVVADPDFTLDVDIARELEDQLAGLDDADFTYEVRMPENTGTVTGRDATERAASAAELAAEIDADVVVYGFGDPEEAISPEFYVSARNLGDALELAGPYPMGARIAASAGLDAASRRELRLEVLARTGSLTDFVVGLVNLKTGKAEEARTWFGSAASRVTEWESSANSEVFHLYLGSANVQLDDLDAAQASYEVALRLQPDYARALIGLAEVQFQRSRGRCTEGTTDDAGLVEAIRGYDEAAAQPSPPNAQIEIKAALGRGRVMTCRSQAGSVSDWDAARDELSSVIDAYTGGETGVRELAALAYGSRALTSLRLNVAEPTETQLQEAATDLEQGFEAAAQAGTRATYAALLGFVYNRLGDSAATEQWCSLAEGPCPATVVTPRSAPADEADDADDADDASNADGADGTETPPPDAPPSSDSASSDEAEGDPVTDDADSPLPDDTVDGFPDVFDAPLPATR